MFLFCNSSALFKHHSAAMASNAFEARVHESDVVAASSIAWARFHAALSLPARTIREDSTVTKPAEAALTKDCLHSVLRAGGRPLVERAGEYADSIALRDRDSGCGCGCGGAKLGAAFEADRIAHSLAVRAYVDLRLTGTVRLAGPTCW